MYAIEKRVDVDENRIKVSEHRIEDLEQEEKRHEDWLETEWWN